MMSAMSRTWWFSEVRPTLNASPWIASLGATRAARIALAYILDMDHRPPRRSVALDEHLAGRERARDEVVDDQVQAKVGRVPVDGRVPQEDRAEVVVGQFGDGTFREDLRLAVRGHRVEGSGFGEQIVGRRRSVQAARRGEDEPFDPRLLGQSSDPDGAEMIDLERARGIQMPEWVVRDRREVHDGVEPPKVIDLDVPDVQAKGRRRRSGSGPSVQPSNQNASSPVTSWPASRDHRREDRPDVAVVARDQDPHVRWSRAARRRSTSFPAASGPGGCPCIARTRSGG